MCYLLFQYYVLPIVSILCVTYCFNIMCYLLFQYYVLPIVSILCVTYCFNIMCYLLFQYYVLPIVSILCVTYCFNIMCYLLFQYYVLPIVSILCVTYCFNIMCYLLFQYYVLPIVSILCVTYCFNIMCYLLFQYYVLPIVSYCSQVWNFVLRQNIDLIERVQRRYTKSIRGLRDLSYSDRLSSLGALTLENHRLFNDMVTEYESLHSITNFSPDSLGLSTVTSNTRGCGEQLKQARAINKSCAALFSHR